VGVAIGSVLTYVIQKFKLATFSEMAEQLIHKAEKDAKTIKEKHTVKHHKIEQKRRYELEIKLLKEEKV